MAYSWAKVYIEILEDAKMGQLPDNLWRRVIEMILLAKRIDKDGTLPGLAEMAWTLRTSIEQLEADLQRLQSIHIVEIKDGNWFLINFAKRQDAESSTERVREFRKRESSRQPSWQEQIYSKFPESPGIYCIRCLDTGMEYIGGSVNLKQRVAQHLSEMKMNRGHPMYSDFREYGIASIEAEVVEVVKSTDEIKDAENRAISSRDVSKLYNHEPVGKRNRTWNENGTYRSTDKTKTKTRLDKDGDIGANTAPAKPRKYTKRDERTDTPAIQACYKTVGKYPPLGLYDKLIGALGNAPDIQRLTECRTAWLERGYNSQAWTWATEWYASGVPSRNGSRNDNGKDKLSQAERMTRERLANGKH